MKQINTKQAGFTLVELLVVMLVLVALSSITLDFTQDFAFQGRYEVTKDRYDKIKRAIIGRPDVLINGQPDISGFVADVGRLPRNIRELLSENYCLVKRTIHESDTNAAATCNAITASSWITQANWKGPYLTVTKEVTDAGAFSDGWGNEASNLTDHNYGWTFCLGSMAVDGCYTSSPVIGVNELLILSKGKNQVTGGAANTYDEDYPVSQPSIKQVDWMVDLDGVMANLIASSINGSCTISSQPIDPATCGLAGRVWAAGICSGTAVPASKLGCESVGGTWSYGVASDLCIRVTKNLHIYHSDGILPTITENGREQIISFPSVFYDANTNTTKEAGENMIPLGRASIGIYTDCSFTDKYNDPAGTRNEVEINIFPNTTRPVINW